MKLPLDSIATLHCDAGWRNYHFVQVTSGDLVGWAEYDEGFASSGVTTTIEEVHFDVEVSDAAFELRD